MNDNIDRWLIEYTTHNVQNENAYRHNKSKKEIKRYIQEAIREAYEQGKTEQLDKDRKFIKANLQALIQYMEDK